MLKYSYRHSFLRTYEQYPSFWFPGISVAFKPQIVKIFKYDVGEKSLIDRFYLHARVAKIKFLFNFFKLVTYLNTIFLYFRASIHRLANLHALIHTGCC